MLHPPPFPWRRLALVCWLSAGCAGPAFTSGSEGGTFSGTGGTGGEVVGSGGVGKGEAQGGVFSGHGGAGSGDAGSGGAGRAGAPNGGAPNGGAPNGGAPNGGAPNGGAPNGGAQTTTGGGGGWLSSGGTGGGAGGAAAISTDGLLLWLAADRGVTTTSGAVSKWQDQSDNHADATQVTPNARPRAVSASGSRTMIEFDGEDDALALPEGFADFSKGLSFFAVLEVLDESTCSSIVQLSNGPEIADIDFGRQQRSVHYEAAENYVTGTPDALGKGERRLVGIVQGASAEVELRVDGQYLNGSSMPLPQALPRVANFIARSLYSNCSPLNARIGEIILYARALDSAERSRVETYLRSRWSCCSN